MSKKTNKNLLIVGLLVIVVIMAVSYAAFSTSLTISGTSQITSNFCVGFDSRNTDAYTATAGGPVLPELSINDSAYETNYTYTSTESLSVTPIKIAAAIPSASITFDGSVCQTNYKTNATLSSTFTQPGDKVVYTLTIANKGTLNAVIDSITVDGVTKTSTFTTTKGNIKYTVSMPLSNTLAANTGTTTMTVTAEFQNDTDISYYTGESQTISIGINAVEGSGSSGGSSSTFTGTIYRWNTNTLLDGLTMNGDVTIYYSSDYYSSAQEAYDDGEIYLSQSFCEEDYDNCSLGTVTLSPGTYITEDDYPTYSSRVTALGKNYYLKHDVINDIVTASYVCFVSETEHCLQGGIDECLMDYDTDTCTFTGTTTVFNANTLIIQAYQTYYSLPNNANPGCDFNSSTSRCNGGSFDDVYADPAGYVDIRGSSSEGCYGSGADIGGMSYCTE